MRCAPWHDGRADVEIPRPLRQAIDEAVTRSLRAELDARGLLLTRAASGSATMGAARAGKALLPRVVAACYQDSLLGDRAPDIEFDGGDDATRIELALAFGSVTADLLTPPRTGRAPDTPVDLLCASFNLGIGLVDDLCDGTPPLGLPFLAVLEDMDLSGAAHDGWPDHRLLSSLPESLTADPTVAFTARIIEAFFGLLHSCYPDQEGSALRDHVGALLEVALEAESRSVDRAVGPVAHEQLIEYSRRTSVVPFQIIEHLATGDPALASPTAGTLLGEAMWRIDDLVDLARDAGLDALNGVLLGATQEPGPATASDAIATLEKVLRSHAIPLAAAQAAESLDAGLSAAASGPAAGANRLLFLSFVQRYAAIAPSDESPVGP
jgi:hypothetical protein